MKQKFASSLKKDTETYQTINSIIKDEDSKSLCTEQLSAYYVVVRPIIVWIAEVHQSINTPHIPPSL